MELALRDLISITEAAEKYKISVNDILFDALDGDISLAVISEKVCREVLVPCSHRTLREEEPAEFVEDFVPWFKALVHADIEIGQILVINSAQIKQLIAKKEFSEVELYRNLGNLSEAPETLGNVNIDFWRTEREIHGWEEDDRYGNVPSGYALIGLDKIKVVERELELFKQKKSKLPLQTLEPASNTALKVIALLMHHLAKSPKYASGASPNKSQIKELLLDLAEEQGINSYGLSKVDERLLAEAMKYLETQKL